MTTPPTTSSWRVKTRQDVVRWLVDLTGAVVPHIDGGLARLGYPLAQTDERVAGLEGFARPLWGLGALAAGESRLAFHDWPVFLNGLEQGSDPLHPTYWGEAQHRDQRMVEMAAIGYSLALAPQVFWEGLTPAAQGNLADWLSRINGLETADNNWHWFKAMVNLGLKSVGRPHDEAHMQQCLARLDEFYRGDGWYSDGVIGHHESRMDYYIPFAMHYYALIYSQLNGQDDPERAATYRERARCMAAQFQHWFADDGAAIPFGRSLTYRFASASFWGALAFAGVEALPWGVIKGLYMRNLRWWQQQSVTDRSGVLTVGYCYPNPAIAEQYISSGSPYWATKAFLPLALPESHPFWQASELPLPLRPALVEQPYGRVLLQHDPLHSVLFPAGQHALWARHGAEKYAKFAYSSLFAFSIPSGRNGLEQGAFDSTFAVSLDGRHFVPREQDITSEISADRIRVTWRPLPGVDIVSWILPVEGGHLRLHRVTTNAALHTAEGGWAVPLSREEALNSVAQQAQVQQGELRVALLSLIGERQETCVKPHANTNLHAAQTIIPMLTSTLEPGQHWLGCAALAGSGTAPMWPSHAEQTRWREQLQLIIHQEHLHSPTASSGDPA